jgi:hypothetical protein
MAERGEAPALHEAGEAPEAPSRDVLQEDALDRVLRAEGKDLVEPRFVQRGHAARKL